MFVGGGRTSERGTEVEICIHSSTVSTSGPMHQSAWLNAVILEFHLGTVDIVKAHSSRYPSVTERSDTLCALVQATVCILYYT